MQFGPSNVFEISSFLNYEALALMSLVAEGRRKHICKFTSDLCGNASSCFLSSAREELQLSDSTSVVQGQLTQLPRKSPEAFP